MQGKIILGGSLSHYFGLERVRVRGGWRGFSILVVLMRKLFLTLVYSVNTLVISWIAL